MEDDFGFAISLCRWVYNEARMLKEARIVDFDPIESGLVQGR